jgi:hypothetical protein
MKIDALIVCDAATVREGLLHILGGGLTRLWRDVLPGPLNVQLALAIEFDEADLDLPHEIEIVMQSPSGADVFRIQGGFQVPRPDRLEDGELQLVPLTFDTRNAGLIERGRHEIRASVDSGEEVMKAVWVLHPEEALIPPLK